MREWLYSLLYDNKEKVLSFSHFLSLIGSIFAFILIILENGFYLIPEHTYWVRIGFDTIYVVFTFGYLLQLIFSFDRIQFIKNTRFEATIIFVIILSGLSHVFLNANLVEKILYFVSDELYDELYRIIITASLLYIMWFKFVKASRYFSLLHLKPAGTLILSFVLLIGIGTSLLMLPQMSTVEGGAPFLVALFTSTSASCVTGLSLIDVGTYFTLKGQIVLMVLVQLGGIGMVSFALFFATFIKGGIGLKQQALMQDFMSSESVFSARSLLRSVVLITFICEFFSFCGIYLSWGECVTFNSTHQKIFYSAFHAVSAFCNAGFSLFPNGLYQESIRESYLMHAVIAITIIFGGIGFSTIQDVFSPYNMRERLKKPWKEWKLSSKIAIFTSMGLILFGAVVFYLIEANNNDSIKQLTTFERVIISFFQSVSTRTAGFNTIDISVLKTPTLIIMIFLMFIGASSGSTGGGIKTSTFLMILVSSVATIRGKKTVDMAHRSISTELLFKAYSIFVFAASYSLICIFVLSVLNPDLDIIKVVFEAISAFTTTGLSTGITSELSTGSHYLLIFTMFIGRIGTLTLALALSTRVTTNKYKYPNAHLMIG